MRTYRPAFWFWFLAPGLIIAASAAHAGPPFVTDDPEPVDLQHFEVYIASQYSRDSSGVSYTGPHVEVNYGAAPGLQLHVIAPYVTVRPEGGRTERGYGDTELGIKYRFIQERANRPQVGVFPLVELPTGSGSRGVGSGHTQVFIPVWLQKSWGRWTTYGGGGYWHNPGEGNRNWWLTGWEIQKDLSDRLTVGAEVFHATPSEVDGESRTDFNIGGIANIDEGHHLLFSGGRALDGPDRFIGYVAYQWTFGPKQRVAGKP